jgi:hypothetical protein
LEHFDRIFTELNPPELLYLPEALSTDPQIIHNFRNEFENIADVKYYDSWIGELKKNKGFSQNDFLSLMQHRRDTYVFMKFLDIEEVNNISNLLITDPPHADTLLTAYEYLIEPIFDPLRASKNYSLSEIQHYRLNSIATKMRSSSSPQISNLRSFPVEIGRYITKKLVLYPSSYSGCVAVIQHYHQNELYKVLEALDKAIKSQKGDEVPNRISELNEIMDNSLKDANKVNHLRGAVRYGISVAIGGVTTVGSSLTGVDPSTTMGLLASFGFLAVDKALSKVEMSIADKLTRLFFNQYLVNVYDFKQKHKLE